MSAKAEANACVAEVMALPSRYTPFVRAVRKARSKAWKDKPVSFVTAVALDLAARREHRWERWFAYELIRFHKDAFAALNDRTFAKLAVGLDSWDSVDALGRILVGPAWVRGLVSDALIDKWSRAKDLWHRRLALVATIGLNMPMDGGKGDTRRTLATCKRMVDDHEDMIVKALSWALRILVDTDRKAVIAFVETHKDALVARVKREVATKLRTGTKNKPKGKAG
jgi:3-methyladenine DNA glycosylase AlkD